MNKNVLIKLLKAKMELSDTLIEILPVTMKSTVHNIRRDFIEAAHEALSDYLQKKQDTPKKSNNINQIQVE